MWIATLDLDPKRALVTSLLGRFWRGAYFSSFAPLQVQNLPRRPLPAPDWVRVRNRLAGICGSDLPLIAADVDPRVAAALAGQQLYPGHEVVGEVIEVGDAVQTLQVGDIVVLQYAPHCLTLGVPTPCRACAAGDYNLCERAYQPGPAQIGSGWSEEMLVHERQLFRLPASPEKPGEPLLSDEQAVMLEPTAVALHAVLRCPPQPHERVLIIGAGTIGLLTLQVVRALVPDAVVGVMARHAFQVERATRLGAAHIIYPQDRYREVARVTGAELVSGPLGQPILLGGYDVIYDTVGRSQTLQDALRWTRAGGTVVLVGRSLHRLHLDLTPVWSREVNLIGSQTHGQEYWPPDQPNRSSTFAVACELIAQGLLAPEQLITHRFALSDYRHALSTAMRRAQTRAIKVIFDYALQPALVVPNVRASRMRRRQAAPAALHLPHAAPSAPATTGSLSQISPQGDSESFGPSPSRGASSLSHNATNRSSRSLKLSKEEQELAPGPSSEHADDL
uniref:Alcohol dehydrogenase n=1 Tax=Thermogemmatispora argillosa TaxID=2045280 RepID=A0A455T3V4_9CHLR|nr:alcohol dehydrogenase [Thermogemmatispora argillosa]